MEDYKIVLDNLDKAIKDKIPDALKTAMEKACLIVEADAKKNCPVDDGQLRQSITHDVSTDNGTIEGTIGTNVEYAPYVEIGTGIYSAEGTGRKGGWLYPGISGVEGRNAGKWGNVISPQGIYEDIRDGGTADRLWILHGSGTCRADGRKLAAVERIDPGPGSGAGGSFG